MSRYGLFDVANGKERKKPDQAGSCRQASGSILSIEEVEKREAESGGIASDI